MSSMLQFDGQTGPQGVRLEFYLTAREGSDNPVLGEDVDLCACTRCDASHPHLWTAWRKPAGQVGCWVGFRYNGEEQFPDLSLPIPVFKIPRGAQRMTIEENAEAWHRC